MAETRTSCASASIRSRVLRCLIPSCFWLMKPHLSIGICTSTASKIIWLSFFLLMMRLAFSNIFLQTITGKLVLYSIVFKTLVERQNLLQ